MRVPGAAGEAGYLSPVGHWLAFARGLLSRIHEWHWLLVARGLLSHIHELCRRTLLFAEIVDEKLVGLPAGVWNVIRSV